MITDAELNKLEDNFQTADLMRAVDEIDKMRGSCHRPPLTSSGRDPFPAAGVA
jgi:hypothetical protein